VFLARIQKETEASAMTDVMGWVEDDEEKLARTEQAWLWIHRAA
jgi:hypothetical protein